MTTLKLPGNNSHKMSIMFIYVKYMASQMHQVLLNIISIVFCLPGFKKLIETYALNMAMGKVSKITVQIPMLFILLVSKSFSSILV